jgi:putative phosphoribosyl transferase
VRSAGDGTSVQLPFADRRAAGQELAAALGDYRGRRDVIVLALPRGGAPVGYQVARSLGAPLDVYLVRKLGLPGHEELAIGAIASGGVRVLNDRLVRELGVDADELESVVAAESKELRRRDLAYRGDRPPSHIEGRTVIVVDDGLATGASMRAAVGALRDQRPSEIIVAVPVGPAETCALLEPHVDRLTCLATPRPFTAVGAWYRDFSPVGDDEVRDLLRIRATELTESS